jgi:hypothetical protein
MFGKRAVVISVLALALMCAVGAMAKETGASPAAGSLSQVGTAFTYQGQLLSSGTPVSDTCDFEFSLWDAAGSGIPPTGGNQVGSTQSAPSIPVRNGLFAVQLDFGSGAFTGEARWLQTSVRCPAGSGTYTTLVPRQALNPVPYALFSQDLSLPFQKAINSPLNAFSVKNQGSGPAGLFEIDNSANTSAALKAHSWGAGAALGAWAWGSADALWANTYGTGDVAAFKINNPDNVGTVIKAETNGTGRVAYFNIKNPLNSASALFVQTDGSGEALAASADSGTAGWFNASGAGEAIWAQASGSGTTIFGRTTGTGGVAVLKIENPNNADSLINASTNGTGMGASFRINNPLNSAPALHATTDGSGWAGDFSATGAGGAVSAWALGSGRAINATSQGTNDVVWLKVDNPNSTGNLINASTNGTGQGASFRINNPLNSQVALHATTDGSGSAGWFKTTGAGDAVSASTDGSGWAGNFSATGSGNGVLISAPAGNQGLNVVGGSKNAVVATSEGARLLYSEESSAVWFTDYGFGRLTDGSVFITIDPLFAETVNLDAPYHVFVQAYGDAELYVSQRTPTGFEVRLRAGDPEVEFSYRLVAARRGYEGKRLEHAAWADNDPNLYPTRPAVPQKGDAR